VSHEQRIYFRKPPPNPGRRRNPWPASSCRLDAKTGKVSSPVSPETKAKIPVAIGNARGEVLLVWAEGTGWAKGGNVAWRFTTEQAIHLRKKPCRRPATWSLPTAFPTLDGNFAIVY